MIHIGFTGTRHGWRVKQRATIQEIVATANTKRPYARDDDRQLAAFQSMVDKMDSTSQVKLEPLIKTLGQMFGGMGGGMAPLHADHVTAHIGDCLGADAEFYFMAKILAWRTVGHVPNTGTHRAFLDYDETRAPLPYLERNLAIVNASDLVLATPYEMTEQQRGGTWATIRMARRAAKPLVIVLPDGTTQGSWT